MKNLFLNKTHSSFIFFSDIMKHYNNYSLIHGLHNIKISEKNNLKKMFKIKFEHFFTKLENVHNKKTNFFFIKKISFFIILNSVKGIYNGFEILRGIWKNFSYESLLKKNFFLKTHSTLTNKFILGSISNTYKGSKNPVKISDISWFVNAGLKMDMKLKNKHNYLIYFII